MKFIKYVFASLVALILFMGIFFLFFVGLIGSALSSGSDAEESKALTSDYILSIELDQAIVDYAEENPFDELGIDIPELNAEFPMGLNDVLNSIASAKEDKRIKAIYLDMGAVQAGSATLSEIRQALENFKSSGKNVYAYAQVYSQKAYYLASVADKVLLHPEGDMELKGLATQLLFFKDFLNQFGVSPQVIRHGKFKSAVEPFLVDQMSEANREQTSTLLNSIWASFAKDISTSRSILVEELNTIVDNFELKSPQDAKRLNFVDELMYFDEFEKLLETDLEDELDFISINKYKKRIQPNKAKDKVAVVFAEGEIRSGKSSNGVMGDETIVKAIRAAKKNEHVKAVVLRVNSPGGSALASDVIWRELSLLKEEKPLVVSMGNLAASGGYYIACVGDKIFAQSNTITGSIGVFGLMFEAQNLVEDKLKLHVDGYKTHQFADIGTMLRPLNTEERDLIQGMVERVYGTFIGNVAKGRDMSVEDVDAIGQGRVWAGADAVSIGLVDEIGGLKQAIAEAANLGNLDQYSIQNYPKQDLGGFDFLFKGMSTLVGTQTPSVLNHPMLKKSIQSIENITKNDNVQARMPFDLYVY
ncbi:MAG: signal peptide peptidase SppA [Flavobacteriales bacterium]